MGEISGAALEQASELRSGAQERAGLSGNIEARAGEQVDQEGGVPFSLSSLGHLRLSS